jgi:TPR repeat protein
MNEGRPLNNGENHDHFPVVRRPSSAIEKAAPGAKRILSSMVVDLLALIPIEDAELQFKKGFDAYNRVPSDFVEAVKWYRKAAEQGHVAAQHNLGLCYQNGHGVSQNDSEAVKWYRKAAEKGNAISQFNLGGCYILGQGVSKDVNEGIKWFQKAANQGYVSAQYWLGFQYEGQPSLKSTESYKWLNLAAEQGHEGAVKHLAIISSKMSQVELQEGEQLYREFNR